MASLKVTGAELTVRILIEQNITTVFGYPGGQVLDIYESLYRHRKEIKHVLTAHEQGAAHAADGYSRATGKIGVCIATSGPGATNLVTGIAAAYMDSIPLVIITGNVQTSQIGTDSFQEVDITGITMPITKHNFFVDTIEELPGVLRKAFVLAKSGRQGPVLIDIPKDVQEALCTYVPIDPVKAEQPFAAKDIRIKEAAEIINNSKRPFIYFGGGIRSSESSDEMLELADRIDAPIGCSMMGLSCISSAHPRFLGMQGMHGHYASTQSMNKADVIIALGVRFNDRSTNNRLKFAANAKIVHIDVDGSELSKTVNDSVSLRGDLKLTLKALLPLIDKRTNEAWMKIVEKFKAEEKTLIKDFYFKDRCYISSTSKRSNTKSGKALKNEPCGLKPIFVFDILNKLLDADTLIATDVGQHQLWAAQMLEFSTKRQFISSGGLGAMGFGMGAAIGAYMATGKKTILITGDGSFGMNLNELATAVTYKVPLAIIILNNSTLGLVRQYQTMFYKKHYSSTDINRKTDFVALAKAFGAEGVQVSSNTGLEEALRYFENVSLPNAVPYVIECIIYKDEPVLPMLKPNGSTEDIITDID